MVMSNWSLRPERWGPALVAAGLVGVLSACNPVLPVSPPLSAPSSPPTTVSAPVPPPSATASVPVPSSTASSVTSSSVTSSSATSSSVTSSSVTSSSATPSSVTPSVTSTGGRSVIRGDGPDLGSGVAGDLVEQATGETTDGDVELHDDGGSECKSLTTVSSPVRASNQAYRHFVDDCGERAELSFDKVSNSGEYTYAWSFRVDEDSVGDDKGVHLNQWSYYPTGHDFREHCGGVGHKLTLGSSGLRFGFAIPGGGCERIVLASAAESVDRWVDVIMHSKWSRGSDGFIVLYLSYGDGYREVARYTGATTDDWNSSGSGPNFKMGAYTGDSGNGRWLVDTDEYRLWEGDAVDEAARVLIGG